MLVVREPEPVQRRSVGGLWPREEKEQASHSSPPTPPSLFTARIGLAIQLQFHEWRLSSPPFARMLGWLDGLVDPRQTNNLTPTVDSLPSREVIFHEFKSWIVLLQRLPKPDVSNRSFAIYFTSLSSHFLTDLLSPLQFFLFFYRTNIFRIHN